MFTEGPPRDGANKKRKKQEGVEIPAEERPGVEENVSSKLTT